MIAPQPNFLLLKEIRATVLSLDTYMEIRRIRHGQLEQKVQYAYLDGRLLGYQSYTRGQLDTHYTYIYEPFYISDAQAKVLSGLYAKFVTQ